MKILLLALLPFISPVLLEGDEEPDPAAGIEWKSDAGKEKFLAAHALYKEGKFKEAKKLFKKASSDAKGKKSRNLVKRWEKAAVGAAKLAEIKSGAESTGEKLRSAKQAAGLFKGTAIEKDYESYIAELKGKMFVTLDDFERVTSRYSEKQGKRFLSAEDDPGNVKEGKRSLEWKIKTSPAELKIKKLPKNLEEFRSVAFWFHFDGKRGARYEVVFMCKGSSKEQSSGKTTRNGFVKAKAPHRGWQRIEIPLKSFTSYGKSAWTDVKDFRIRFEGQKGFTVMVDDIVLIRR